MDTKKQEALKEEALKEELIAKFNTAPLGSPEAEVIRKQFSDIFGYSITWDALYDMFD